MNQDDRFLMGTSKNNRKEMEKRTQPGRKEINVSVVSN